MTLQQRLIAARVAESALVVRHTELRSHLAEIREARDQLLSPERIVFGGLAIGFLAGRFGPARQPPPVQAPAERNADLLHHAVTLASNALPLLMPYIIARSASKIAEVAEPEVERVPGVG